MFDDTIAAISTAPGRSGLAVVRASGSGMQAVVTALDLPALEPRRGTFTTLKHPEDGKPIDQVVATLFRAPASYTGEDVLEITCHGGALVPQLVLDAMCAAGARLAEPGEFTRRAYLNGKLDLLQVEATVDLIDARSMALHEVALHQLDGGLSRRIETIRQAILRLEAMLAYEIDFPEEDEGPIPAERIDSAARAVEGELDALLRNAPQGELLREGALTVIAGRPNSGKSSLFNALVGESRAIVTEIPGTTRDAIEALVSLGGYPFRLVDTAGLRDEAGYVEELGIEVARRYLDRAELVLFCAEAGRPLDAEECYFLRGLGGKRTVILVRTKLDLAAEPAAHASLEEDPHLPVAASVVAVSALESAGLSRLREVLLTCVYSGIRAAEDAPLLTRRRQTRAVGSARQALGEFDRARRDGLPPEISATHCRDASTALEELLGVVEAEDVLDVLFASFCVGK
jgi:tRNA modification GTPase